jgi:hypothetical protein
MIAISLFALMLGVDAAQAAGLRIRVIAGEGVVNVMQQKTAVSPVIEVEDRNGLPVAGATVTFTIVGSGIASFPSASSTFTVVTDAQGQATSAPINLVGAGTFAIRVRAVSQGLSGAATIAQTNVASAAKAEAATNQTPQPVPIGGKGVSKKALGAIGAAGVGSGAFALTQAGGDTAQAPVTGSEPSVVARSFRLTGTFEGTLVHNVTFPSGGAPCTIDHAVRVELSSELTFVGEDLRNTTFRISEADTPTAWTCNVNTTLTNTFLGSGTMGGSASALIFRMARNFTTLPDPGVTQVVDLFHEFTGSFDGTAVFGTYSFDRRILRTGAGGVREETVSRMSIPVTLR